MPRGKRAGREVESSDFSRATVVLEEGCSAAVGEGSQCKHRSLGLGHAWAMLAGGSLQWLAGM